MWDSKIIFAEAIAIQSQSSALVLGLSKLNSNQLEILHIPEEVQTTIV